MFTYICLTTESAIQERDLSRFFEFLFTWRISYIYTVYVDHVPLHILPSPAPPRTPH